MILIEKVETLFNKYQLVVNDYLLVFIAYFPYTFKVQAV